MMKEASLAALQERLVALELLVKAKEGASCTSFPTPNATILAKACALQQSISNLECTSMPHLKDFYKKCKAPRCCFSFHLPPNDTILTVSLTCHTDVQLLKKSDLNEPEAVDGEGNPLQKNDSELKLATLATKAAIVCSYEEEAKQIATQTKILESYLEMLKNERLDGISPPPKKKPIQLLAKVCVQLLNGALAYLQMCHAWSSH